MADSYTPNLNLRKPEVGAAKDNWGSVPGLNGDMDILDAIFTSDGSGTSVGLHVGTGKTADMTGGTALVTADRFRMWDDADPTKSARIIVSDVTGPEQDFFLPPLSDILVGVNQAQNLTNKTLTSPAITDAAITRATMTGLVTSDTPAPGDNSTTVATTAFIAAAAFAPINNPVFTGDPKAPTPAAGDSDTSIATTKFVSDAIAVALPVTAPFQQAAFIANGTFTPTRSGTYKVTLTGGGGGGQQSSNAAIGFGGWGGGAGATVIAFQALVAGTPYPVVVGGGGGVSGAGTGLPGSSGGASTFNGLSAGGGSNSGAGGTATGGLMSIPGGIGGQGGPPDMVTGYYGVGGNGGASYLGGWGAGGWGAGSFVNANPGQHGALLIEQVQ